jgi:hypothetical protein
LFAFPTLDLVVAMNCGNYRKSGLEQSHINAVVLNEVVLPSFVYGRWPYCFTVRPQAAFSPGAQAGQSLPS